MRYDPETATKPKRERVVWTQEEDLLIIDAHENGLSYTEIADLLTGRTREAVAGRFARLRIKALPREEQVRRRKEAEARWPRRPSNQGKGGGPKPTTIRKPRLSGQTPLKTKKLPSAGRMKYVPKTGNLLPHVFTKERTLLHVYHRDPYVLLPLATFERRGERWIRRGDPEARFTSVPEAVRSLEAA